MTQKDEGPTCTLAELVPGEVALCLRLGDKLHVIREHMTPQEATSMLKDVLTGKITADDLSKYEWRTVNIADMNFTGIEKFQLPPREGWPP